MSCLPFGGSRFSHLGESVCLDWNTGFLYHLLLSRETENVINVVRDIVSSWGSSGTGSFSAHAQKKFKTTSFISEPFMVIKCTDNAPNVTFWDPSFFEEVV
ncbi:hypothetical protein AMECASPLE_022200 [Ameca splendens]|uniref:Uncharacterized protein n=1 Tax=Ameca splendens TaxID=208324 RepID=A0ABV0ZDK7_9TELE